MRAMQVRHLGHRVEGSVHSQGHASDSGTFTFVPRVPHLPHSGPDPTEFWEWHQERKNPGVKMGRRCSELMGKFK